MNEIGPKRIKPGKVISHRFDDAPRDMVPEARWLDIWQQDSVKAIGEIVEMSSARSQSDGAQQIFEFLTGNEPVILFDEFEEAAMEWLNQGQHPWYQYKILLDSLEHRDQFLSPKILDWFLKNFDFLQKIPGSPHYGWSFILDKLSGLKQGKSFKDLREEWMAIQRKTNRLGKARIIIEDSKDSIEREFDKTANDWLSCVGSIIFQLETLLSTEKAKTEIGAEMYEEINKKLELVKEKLYELKRQYPYEEPQPPDDVKNEILSMLNVI